MALLAADEEEVVEATEVVEVLEDVDVLEEVEEVEVEVEEVEVEVDVRWIAEAITMSDWLVVGEVPSLAFAYQFLPSISAIFFGVQPSPAS